MMAILPHLRDTSKSQLKNIGVSENGLLLPLMRALLVTNFENP
jgi:hypothetical protein